MIATKCRAGAAKPMILSQFPAAEKALPHVDQRNTGFLKGYN